MMIWLGHLEQHGACLHVPQLEAGEVYVVHIRLGWAEVVWKYKQGQAMISRWFFRLQLEYSPSHPKMLFSKCLDDLKGKSYFILVLIFWVSRLFEIKAFVAIISCNKGCSLLETYVMPKDHLVRFPFIISIYYIYMFILNLINNNSYQLSKSLSWYKITLCWIIVV